MHKGILTDAQTNLLPLLKEFNKDFGLVGGTAIALHLGHRRSIDFDLFSGISFGNKALINQISNVDQIFIDQKDELSLVIKGVKVTFLYYPFEIKYIQELEDVIKLPNLKTLAAMKAYALGRRSKWKDYVDLYFILKNNYSIQDIIQEAEKIFQNKFNEKLFRSQLAYFEDIDYAESVEFLPEFATEETDIKEFLVKASLS